MDIKKNNFFNNVFGVSAVEFTWGLGLPLVVDSTFLPLFLKNLGASNTLVGLIPTLFFFGTSVFPLVSGLLTSGTGNKRKVVLTSHLYPGIVLLLLGLILLLASPSNILISVFLLCYALFSAGIGFLLPVWQNYLVTIFSSKQSVSALSVMMLAQSAAKLISSLMIQEFVRRFAFSLKGSAILFMATGALFFLGSFFFLFTREIFPTHEDTHKKSKNPINNLKEVLKNRNFIMFLGNELEIFSGSSIIAFYATYATGYCGIPDFLAAGLFVTLNYTGAVLTNIVLGWFNFLSIKRKCLLSKALSILAVILLVLGKSTLSFLIVSFLLGTSRAVRWLIYAPAIKKISRKQDATIYFSIAPILTLPFSAGIPLLNGLLLDSFVNLGAGSYRIVFALQAVFILFALLSNLKTDFEGVKEDLEALNRDSHPLSPGS